ncbi:hypothetical protein [Chengkuizengella marina]|uniref:Uncharacterized protein n=1 Tax=Chengkuizengella marina TaxID=2507566 RepID=A0A6N9Q9F4_9BACL|nr:hypothetical protein [Chengkuizengella marina]NBI31214.1 hypothetical protein [Chengkuizengella marina]
MGVFDESKCDCCVCPMQCVLEQLIGREDINLYNTNNITNMITITGVKEFIVSTSAGDFPIHQIILVQLTNSIDQPITITLKPLKKNVRECACCEDPMANLANSMKGDIVFVEYLNNFGPFQEEILKVGEGIVMGRFPGDPRFTDIFSTCAITRIINQQQSSAGTSSSRHFNINTSPPTT